MTTAMPRAKAEVPGAAEAAAAEDAPHPKVCAPPPPWLLLSRLLSCCTLQVFDVLHTCNNGCIQSSCQKEHAFCMQHAQARELNTYWENGGDGVPKEASSAGNGAAAAAPPPQKASGIIAGAKIGDGGASWRLKALRRAQEAAAEQGRSVSEVVAQRYGSLKDLTASLTERHAAHCALHSPLCLPLHIPFTGIPSLLLCIAHPQFGQVARRESEERERGRDARRLEQWRWVVTLSQLEAAGVLHTFDVRRGNFLVPRSHGAQARRAG